MNNAIAIIPARGGSVRIPRKNIMPLNGIPAIGYPIKACNKSGLFNKVIVSTEDDEIAETSTSFGAEVWSRPLELADGQASIHQVVRNVLNEITSGDNCSDVFCIVYATAVLLEPQHLTESFHLLNSNKTDSVLAVRRYCPHPYKALKVVTSRLTPEFPDEFKKKSQSFPEFFAPAGVFHWMKSNAFLSHEDVWEMNRMHYALPPHIALDLDEPEDIEIIKRLLVAREQLRIL